MRSVWSDESGGAVVFAIAAVAALLLAVPVAVLLSEAPADLTQAQRLGGEIGCVCGTCPLRPIATCGCGFADGMLTRLDAAIAEGHTDEAIMATFVAEYGPSIKIKPEGSGVGLIAWLAPIAFLMVGAVAMAGTISHWRANAAERSGDAPSAATPADAARDSQPTASASSDRYRDIVERELDAFDD